VAGKPFLGAARGDLDVFQVGVEVRAVVGDELLRLARPGECGALQAGVDDAVPGADDHQQWRRGNPLGPEAAVVGLGVEHRADRDFLVAGEGRWQRVLLVEDPVRGVPVLIVVDGGDGGVGAVDGHPAGLGAVELGGLVVVAAPLPRQRLGRRHPLLRLLVAADGRDLGDDGLDPPVAAAQDQRVAAGEAGPPQADPAGVDAVEFLQVGEYAAPVVDLPPGVDVAARPAAAEPVPAVIVDDDDKPGPGEALGEGDQALVLEPGEPVRHGDRGCPAAGWESRPVNPGVQPDSAVRRDPVFFGR